MELIELDLVKFEKAINDINYNWFILFYIDECENNIKFKNNLFKILDKNNKIIPSYVKFGMINGLKHKFDSVIYYPTCRLYTIDNISMVYPYYEINLENLNYFLKYYCIKPVKNDIYITKNYSCNNNKNNNKNNVLVSNNLYFQTGYTFILANLSLLYDFFSSYKL